MELYGKSGGGTPLLARWHTEWDCGHETNWWYCIKDTPFDIVALKSKRRYEVNKGNKNFRVEKINGKEHVQELFDTTISAYSGWPEKYRPSVSNEAFAKQIEAWENADVFAGFEIETGKLQGYAVLTDYGSYVEFSILRTEPHAEKNGFL